MIRSRNALLIATLFVFAAACSQKIDSGTPAQDHGAFSGSGSGSGAGANAQSKNIQISIDNLRNPLTPVFLQNQKPWLPKKGYEELPLGYGSGEKDVTTRRALSTDRCFDGKVTVTGANEGTGGFGNSDESFTQIYNEINPFPALWMDSLGDQNGGYTEVAEIAAKFFNQPGVGSTADVIHWTQEYATAKLENPKRISKDCFVGIRERANRVVDTAIFAKSVAVAFKILFPNTDAIEAWRKENNEHPVYSVFDPKSGIDAAKVSARLNQLGASLYVYGFTLAGDAGALEKALTNLGCSTENIAACRQLKKTATDVFNSWVVHEPVTTVDQLKDFEPIYFGSTEVK